MSEAKSLMNRHAFLSSISSDHRNLIITGMEVVGEGEQQQGGQAHDDVISYMPRPPRTALDLLQVGRVDDDDLATFPSHAAYTPHHAYVFRMRRIHAIYHLDALSWMTYLVEDCQDME